MNTTPASTETDSASRARQQALDDLTFGEAMERLEAVVAQLEGDETLELEQTLALHEQGVAVAAACRRRLAGAELRLTEVASLPPDEA